MKTTRSRSTQRTPFKPVLEHLEGRLMYAILADFDFEILPRIHPNSDGTFVIPNHASFVNPVNGFDVQFDARPTVGDDTGNPTEPIEESFRYDWTVRSSSGALLKSLSGILPITQLYEGTFNVQLAVTDLATQEINVVSRPVKIDALVMSIGGNDLGFAKIVQDVYLNAIEPGGSVDSDPEKLMNVRLGFNANLPTLEQKCAELNQTLRNTFDIGRIYLTVPPDPTTKDDGTTGSLLVDGPVPFKEISVAEANWARDNIITPLQNKMKGEALRQDWIAIDDISKAFIGHGYSATAAERYVRKFSESKDLQGDKFGAIHPNAAGYQVYADFIHAELDKLDIVLPTAKIVGPPNIAGGASAIYSAATSTSSPNSQRSYEWDFDFDSFNPDDFTTDLVGESVTYIPVVPLERVDTIALRVTDLSTLEQDFAIMKVHLDPTPGAFLVNRTLRINGRDSTLLPGDDIRVSATASTTTVRTVISGKVNLKTFPNQAYDTIVMRGFRGNDRLEVESSVNKSATLFGDEGNDTVLGGPLADTLDGGDGNDTINGRGGADFILAGTGNDTIILDANDIQENLADIIDAGPGFDGILLYGTNRHDNIQVSRRVDADGTHAVFTVNGRIADPRYASGETITILAGAGHDLVQIDSSAGEKWRANFFGEEGHDLLIGSQQDDHLDGGPGQDVLVGGGGNDELIGNPHTDEFWSTVDAALLDLLIQDHRKKRLRT